MSALQFLLMLNAWEGAVEFSGPGNKTQPGDIERVLVWLLLAGSNANVLSTGAVNII
jgi:hypothetical protein